MDKGVVWVSKTAIGSTKSERRKKQKRGSAQAVLCLLPRLRRITAGQSKASIDRSSSLHPHPTSISKLRKFWLHVTASLRRRAPWRFCCSCASPSQSPRSTSTSSCLLAFQPRDNDRHGVRSSVAFTLRQPRLVPKREGSRAREGPAGRRRADVPVTRQINQVRNGKYRQVMEIWK